MLLGKSSSSGPYVTGVSRGCGVDVGDGSTSVAVDVKIAGGICRSVVVG